MNATSSEQMVVDSTGDAVYFTALESTTSTLCKFTVATKVFECLKWSTSGNRPSMLTDLGSGSVFSTCTSTAGELDIFKVNFDIATQDFAFNFACGLYCDLDRGSSLLYDGLIYTSILDANMWFFFALDETTGALTNSMHILSSILSS